MSPGAVVMVQGTSSDAGKSFLVAALLRWAHHRGLSVAPFKAQNMALNAAVTLEGAEIGRAQAEQAEAARIQPHVDMNPILLKPEGGFRSQVVVLGEAIGTYTWKQYSEMKSSLRPVVMDALDRLRARYDLIVVEGAGSPAEINLQSEDLVNMFVARQARAPVILVTDVDRGGAFGSLFGTWSLLSQGDKALVRAFVFNRIRGDANLLARGYQELERRTGVPVLGAVPYLQDLGAAEEDSLGLAQRRNRARAPLDEVEVTVVDLPHISNYDEFRLLERSVQVRFSRHPRDALCSNLVILPGSKCTTEDLQWIRDRGWDRALLELHQRKVPILGVCGGCQILGQTIVEGETTVQGLGLLPIRTQFQPQKKTTQTYLDIVAWPQCGTLRAKGYEIHRGHVEHEKEATPFGKSADSIRLDGARAHNTCGTMVHGLFENPKPMQALLRWAAPHMDTHIPPSTGLQDRFERAASALDDLDLHRFFEQELNMELAR